MVGSQWRWVDECLRGDKVDIEEEKGQENEHGNCCQGLSHTVGSGGQ